MRNASKQKIEAYLYNLAWQGCISFNVLLYSIKFIIDTSPTGSWVLLELHIKISVIYNVIHTFQVEQIITLPNKFFLR